MTIKTDAMQFLQQWSEQMPHLRLDICAPLDEHDDDMSVALDDIGVMGVREVGAAAQLISILRSDEKPREMLFAIKKLIESGLDGEPESTAVADRFHSANLPAFSGLSAKLTFRFMLKNLPLNSMAAVAALRSTGRVTQNILMSRIQRDTWSSYGSDYGFSFSEYAVKALQPLIARIRTHSDTASIIDACSWFPEGPFPQGYGQAPAANQATAANNATGAALAHVFAAMAVPVGLTGNTATPAVVDNVSHQALAAYHQGKTNQSTQTNQGVPEMTAATTTQATSSAASIASSISPAAKPIVDGMLAQVGIPMTVDSIIKQMDDNEGLRRALASAEKAAGEVIQDLQAKLRQQQSALPATTQIIANSTSLPNGKMEMVDAEKAFPMLAGIKLSLPSFVWDHAHPDVPEINHDYIFRKGMLVTALRCLARGENAWLSGHTGSGKTTFIEQIAARLNWPVARVAFDSNVDRSELVGRMSLKGDGNGGTISEWLPGILERASTGGYILLCDEIDAGHPNALYTLQPLLEGKPLTLLEDGGRVVGRSPMMRIFATGNTTGNGDPSGLYPACRILSAATLDRFQTFINVPYMTVDEEANLINTAAAGLSKTLVKKLSKFASEMRAAFISGNTPISYSPRRSVAFAREVIDLMDMGFKDEAKVLATAFKSKLYDAASEEFRQRITEIANACLGGGIDPTADNNV